MLARLRTVLTDDGRRLGLCWSGGGWRAAAFHAGGLLRIEQLGLLDEVRVIGSVSGGSILSAMLASQLTQSGGELGAAEVHAVIQSLLDVTARAQMLPLISAAQMARRFRRFLGEIELSSVPGKVEFRFCATDARNAIPWIFSQRSMGNSARGFWRPDGFDLADVAAASAAYPFVVRALRVDTASLRPVPMPTRDLARADRSRRVTLVDGGAYDNLAIDAMSDCDAMLVSSAGKRPKLPSPSAALLWIAARSLMSQSSGLRARHLLQEIQDTSSRRRGALWSIGTTPRRYHRDAPVFYPSWIVERLAAVRTSLDAFSTIEIHSLINHGYVQANAALTRLVRGAQLPGYSVPYPDASAEEVWAHLKSRKRLFRLRSKR